MAEGVEINAEAFRALAERKGRVDVPAPTIIGLPATQDTGSADPLTPLSSAETSLFKPCLAGDALGIKVKAR